MSGNEDLSLHEQLMLLMLRDDTGTMESHTTWYQLALGGAMLAELLLQGAIAIDEHDKGRVRLLEKKRPDDPLLASLNTDENATLTYDASVRKQLQNAILGMLEKHIDRRKIHLQFDNDNQTE